MGLKKIKNILIIIIAMFSIATISLIILGNLSQKNEHKSSAADTITAIYDLDDLKAFRDSVNNLDNNYSNVNVYLYTDIDMRKEIWTPIGNHAVGFEGKFYGNGHTLYNYSGDSGIFSKISEGVYDLNVIANDAGLGIVDWFVMGEIKNCTIRGTINSNAKYIGGIVSDFDGGCIISCLNAATINGNDFVGGIVGHMGDWLTSNDTRIISCINQGNISGNTNVGGIVGYMENPMVGTTQMMNCINLGDISGSEYVGGLVGRNVSNGCQTYCCYNSENSGVKGAGVSDSKVGKDFTDGDFYCKTTSDLNSSSGVRNYASDESKWNTDKSYTTENTWFSDSSNSYWANVTSSSNTNNGYPYLKSSALTVTVNVNNSSYGNAGSFQIIKGDSISKNNSSIRVNSSYNVYTASPKSSTDKYTFSFSSWSNIPSGAQYSNFSITANFTASLRKYSITISVSTQGNYGYLVMLGSEALYENITINNIPYGSKVVNGVTDTGYNYIYIVSAENNNWLAYIQAIPDDPTEQYKYVFDSWLNKPATIDGATTIYAKFTRELNSHNISLTATSDDSLTTSNGLGGYFTHNSSEILEIEEVIYGTSISRTSSTSNAFSITPPSGFGDTTTYSAYSNTGYTFSKFQYRIGNGTWYTLGTSAVSLTDEMEIRAVFIPIEYDLPLSYIANEEGTYNSTNMTFNIETAMMPLYNETELNNVMTASEKEYLLDIGKEFGHWIIGVLGTGKTGNLVNNANYSAEINSDRGYIDITGPNGEWVFVYTDILEGIDGNSYYRVTDLLTGSYGDLEEKIITAKWSNTYSVQITNNANTTIWGEKDSEYLGLGGTGEVQKIDNTLQFKVKDNEDYRYPFMSSYMNETYISFYKGNEYTSSLMASSEVGAYYVYNYGYEITDWTIYFEYEGERYYLYLNNNEWQYQTNLTTIDISELVGTDMNDMSQYAEKIDELLGFDGSADPRIVMFPTWQEVTVTIIDGVDANSDLTLSTSKYSMAYTFADMSGIIKTGKSIIYFIEVNNGNIIAIGTGTTIYNYKNITHSQYNAVASSDGALVGTVYELRVKAYYVDNIYKVKLNGARTEEGEYRLTNTDYVLTNDTAYTNSVYTYKDFGYTDYTSGAIEDYTDTTLLNYQISYEQDISNGYLELLRKVYGTDGEFYIYLANEQSTGRLPVFATEYYTLIYWINDNTTADSNRYIYKTTEYSDTLHTGEDKGYSEHADGTWEYIDGGSNKIEDSMTAYYFRKHYDFKVQTLLLGREGQYGYVVVEFEDEIASEYGAEDESGRYLCIYTSKGMEYYEYPTHIESLPTELTSLTKIDSLVLYAGCNVKISIYDQSKDIDAMNSGIYDSMIGYRYKEASGRNINSAVEMFPTSTEYLIDITKEDIESDDSITNTTYRVTVNYEKIQYNGQVEMGVGDSSAGTFRITYPDGSLSAYVTSISLSGIELGDVYYITYNAYTGYEYAEKAYTLILLNGKEVVLQRSDVWETTGEQVYVMRIDGSWLRTNYYTYQDPTYSTVDAKIGTIKVNTQEIEFSYRVKVYDGSKTGEEAWIGEIEMYTWSLKDKEIGLKEAFSEISIGGYGYIHTDGSEYAIISSYIYEPKNPTSRARYYTSYEFICHSQPETKYAITSDILSYMVNNGVYEIIGKDNRTIYMTIEVRKIYSIDIIIEMLEHDTNSSTRTTTISNGTNNIVSVELNNQASHEEGIYLTKGKIYTYEGLTNNISSTYDERRYIGVEYYIDGVLLDKNSVIVSKDSEIRVRYIPNSLGIEVLYELEGNRVSYEEISNILTKFEVKGESEVYLGSSIEIGYTIDSDYNIRIEINEKELVGNIYTIQDIDYDKGKIEIIAKISMQLNEEISVRYSLADSTQSLPNDDIGEMRVYIEGEEVEGLENIRVISGKRVEVRLELNTGYTYYGYKQDNKAINRAEITNNTVELSKSFDIEQDSGEYTIYVIKEMVSAVLEQPDKNSKNYTIEGGEKTVSSGSTRITGIYVGKKIIFNRIEDIETEALKNYYYIDKSGEKKIIEGNEIEITSELLEEIGSLEIKLGVETVNKYKLTIEVVSGKDHAKIETDKEIEIGGKAVYYEEGREINIVISSEREGKYTIIASGAIERIGERIEEKIILDEDKIIEVRVEAKTYTVEVEEYVYTSISEQEKGEPEYENNPVSEVETSGQRYNETGEIRFNKRSANEDREISVIEISEEGIGKIRIEIREGEYSISSEDELDIENQDNGYRITLKGKSYTITEEGDRIKLSYTTEDKISLRLEYTTLKEIRP